MKTNNQLVEKSYAFSLRIVKLYRYLCEEKNEICIIETNFKERDINWRQRRRSGWRPVKERLSA